MTRTRGWALDSKRRASLPGVDELFRSTGQQERRPDEADGVPPASPEDAPPAGGSSPEDRVEEPEPGVAADRGTGPGDGPLASLAEEAAAAVAATRGGSPPATTASVTASIGTLLSFLTNAVGARHVVEVGSADAAAASWVVSSMAPGGTLTVVSEGAAALGREDLLGSRTDIRVRTIPGSPEEVLGRLSDGGYELMVVRGEAGRDRTLRDEAIRLLRPGAVLVVLDLATEGAGSRGHALVRDLADDPRFHVSVLPAGGGIALARLAPSR